MSEEKSNVYDYQAFQAVPREGQQTPALALQPLNLRPLGLVVARDPDQALALAAEQWPPPADQQREYSVCLASKWRSKTYRGRATVAVEEVAVSEEEAPGDGELPPNAPGPVSHEGTA